MGKTSVFCVFIAVLSAVYAQDACITPNGESARCVNIYQCNIFLEALKNRTPQVVDFLRKSTCGFNNRGDPMVCCGSVVGFQTPNPPTRPTGGTSARPTSWTRPTDGTTPRPPGRFSVVRNAGGPAPGTTPQNNPLLPPRGENGCGESEIVDRIIGGTETTIGEFPWMALLSYRDSQNRPVAGYFCGGALINNRYVLTAAHCVVGEIQRQIGTIDTVRLGEWDYRTERDCPPRQDCNDPPLDMQVEEAIAHEEYTRRGNENSNRHHDVALIRLRNPVERYTEFVKPVCLPTRGERSKLGDVLFVAGWGVTETGESSPVKLKVNITQFEQNRCADIFRQNNGVTISGNQICAGGAPGKDSCNGDSGGPLMKTFDKQDIWYVEGIVSYGPRNCGTRGVPGIYTRVYEYMEWIRVNMRP